jgi:hypothetical protein
MLPVALLALTVSALPTENGTEIIKAATSYIEAAKNGCSKDSKVCYQTINEIGLIARTLYSVGDDINQLSTEMVTFSNVSDLFELTPLGVDDVPIFTDSASFSTPQNTELFKAIKECAFMDKGFNEQHLTPELQVRISNIFSQTLKANSNISLFKIKRIPNGPKIDTLTGKTANVMPPCALGIKRWHQMMVVRGHGVVRERCIELDGGLTKRCLQLEPTLSYELNEIDLVAKTLYSIGSPNVRFLSSIGFYGRAARRFNLTPTNPSKSGVDLKPLIEEVSSILTNATSKISINQESLKIQNNEKLLNVLNECVFLNGPQDFDQTLLARLSETFKDTLVNVKDVEYFKVERKEGGIPMLGTQTNMAQCGLGIKQQNRILILRGF